MPLAAASQIRTDATLGRPAASLTGPTFAIPQELGRLAGRNLFHSFETFNLGFGEVARFTASTPNLGNVISRVTGGDISQINGSIHLVAPGAPAFWLLNPAGVVFGAGTSISVPGAFHVSTANYLKFADGRFDADPSQASTFSTFEPEAFGFLGTTRASIRIGDGGELRSRSAVQLVAGDISLNRASIVGGAEDIRVVALGAAAGEVAVSGSVAGARGRLTLVDGAAIRTRTTGDGDAGNIGIYTGTLTLDGAGSANPTGIFSVSEASARGSSGAIRVDASEAAVILNGAAIGTRTRSTGNAGRVRVSAGEMTIDGGEIDDTGIFSLVLGAASGAGGDVSVEVRGALSMFNGAVILSDTESSGTAGSVTVSAQSLLIDGRDTVAFTGISSDARDEATGSANRVEVAVTDLLTIRGTGEISSSTLSGPGDAGAIRVAAGTLLIDGRTSSEYPTGIHTSAYDPGTGNAGNIEVHVAGTATILGGGEIAADTWNSSRGGNVVVTARNLTIDGTGSQDIFTGISSDAVQSTGSAGSVDVRVAETLTIVSSGLIASDTFSDGNAGVVRVEATDILLDGRGRGGGISSDAVSGSGSAGNVFVRASEGLTVLDSGYITSASLHGTGNAGVVTVEARRLVIDGQGSGFFSGIGSQTFGANNGGAGDVHVTVAEDLRIARGAAISSGTASGGPAGRVDVTVGGNLDIREGSSFATGILTTSHTSTSGAAGDVTVAVAGALTITRGGAIASDTFSSANAGSVRVTAGSLRLDGQDQPLNTSISSDASTGSTGSAGNVDVRVSGDAVLLADGRISSITLGSGNAGTVSMHAGSLTIDRQDSRFLTGVSTQSSYATSGHAGNVLVEVDGLLSTLGGGEINSSTFSANGRAGNVSVAAGSILVSGAGPRPSSINAFAAQGSSGQTGSVTMTARDSITVSDRGRISVGNDATVADPSASVPTTIEVTAPVIRLESGGSITAASVGNVAASNIHVNAPGTLSLQDASITTSANLGNGGEIRIAAGVVGLRDSQITTSVAGASGNGGDISVHADVLRLQTGFIQANTAAANAAGGNVGIDADALIASGSLLFVGGSEPLAFRPGVFGLNVIQAAAPTGVSGTIALTSPVLDTSGTLAGLGAPALDTSGVGRSPCRVSAGSSLALLGRGGLAPSALGIHRIDPSGISTASAEATPRLIVGALARSIPCASR